MRTDERKRRITSQGLDQIVWGDSWWIITKGEGSINWRSSRAAVTAQAHKYPVQFARDVEIVERECLAEDIVVGKPRLKDRVKAAVINSYNRGDLEEAKRRQEPLDRKFELERDKRRESKARKGRLQ